MRHIFQVNNKSIRSTSLTTSDWHHWCCSGIFIVNFDKWYLYCWLWTGNCLLSTRYLQGTCKNVMLYEVIRAILVSRFFVTMFFLLCLPLQSGLAGRILKLLMMVPFEWMNYKIVSLLVVLNTAFFCLSSLFKFCLICRT